MTQLALDIDEIVRQVLAQLGLAPQGPAAPSAPPALPPDREPSPLAPLAGRGAGGEGEAKADDAQLLVASRVVTLADVKDQLATVRRVVVLPRAIVTPAVRDELIRRKIALVYRQKALENGKPRETGRARLVLMAVGAAFDPAALAETLASEGIAVEVRRGDCLIRAADELAVELSQGPTLAVLATPYAAAALCLANRLAGVRAVLGADASTVQRDTASVGANLLVVNPAASGTYLLKQVIARFCQEPKHECPEVFAKRLG